MRKTLSYQFLVFVIVAALFSFVCDFASFFFQVYFLVRSLVLETLVIKINAIKSTFRCRRDTIIKI